MSRRQPPMPLASRRLPRAKRPTAAYSTRCWRCSPWPVRTPRRRVNAQLAGALEGAESAGGHAGRLQPKIPPTSTSRGACGRCAVVSRRAVAGAEGCRRPPWRPDASVAAHFHTDAPRRCRCRGAPRGCCAGGHRHRSCAGLFVWPPPTPRRAIRRSAAPDNQAAVTPVIDTTTWNSLTGPAEFFAQARTGHRGARRIRAAGHARSRSALGGRSRQPPGVDGAHRRFLGFAAIDAAGPGTAGSECLGSRKPGHRAFRRRECRDARAARSLDAAPAGNARVARFSAHGQQRLARLRASDAA